MARIPRYFVLFALGLGACNNSTATVVGVTPSTAVSVEPADFLGNVTCGTGAGQMQVYVATIFDVSPHSVLGIGTAQLVLPSSAPTGCGISVLFENVLDGREYSAAVDGYDRGDIAPLAPGSRTMVQTDTGTYVKPRWTTRCGQYRFPPALRKADGGLIANAGHLEFADSGIQEDGGYYDCAPLLLYGPKRAPWLDGPVCASIQQTIPVRGCQPLTE